MKSSFSLLWAGVFLFSSVGFSANFSDLLEGFRGHLVEQEKARRTVGVYLGDIGFFLDWCFAHEIDPHQATTQDLLEFLGSLEKKASSIARMRVSLSRFYQFLLEDRPQENPVPGVRILGVTHKPSFLNPAELLKIIDHPFPDNRVAQRTQLAAFLILSTGIQPKDLLELRFEDVVLSGEKGPYLRVRRGNGEIRVLQIYSDWQGEFQKLFENFKRARSQTSEEAFLFSKANGKQFTDRSLRRDFEVHLASFGIPREKTGFRILKNTYLRCCTSGERSSSLENGDACQDELEPVKEGVAQ